MKSLDNYFKLTEQKTNVKTEVVYYDNPPAEGFNAEESSPFAVILADQVMNSMGGRKAWDDTNVLYWNFFGAPLSLYYH